MAVSTPIATIIYIPVVSSYQRFLFSCPVWMFIALNAYDVTLRIAKYSVLGTDINGYS